MSDFKSYNYIVRHVYNTDSALLESNFSVSFKGIFSQTMDTPLSRLQLCFALTKLYYLISNISILVMVKKNHSSKLFVSTQKLQISLPQCHAPALVFFNSLIANFTHGWKTITFNEATVIVVNNSVASAYCLYHFDRQGYSCRNKTQMFSFRPEFLNYN